MRRLLVLLATTLLGACGGGSPTLCERYEASKRWSALSGFSAFTQTTAFRGTIEVPLPAGGTRSFRDDRHQGFLAASVSGGLRIDAGPRASYAIVPANVRVTMALPGVPGTYTLADVGAEILYCEQAEAVLTGYGSNERCSLGESASPWWRYPLDGEIVVEPRPISAPPADSSRPSFAIHIRGTGTDGSAVDLEVVDAGDYDAAINAACAGER